MNQTPRISAIVIFRNEAPLLDGCLRSLQWCDELIGIDMQSTDASRDIARQYVDRLYEVEPFPIAEPTRVAAAKLAKYDWILLVDPDEHVDPALGDVIRHALKAHDDAGALRLPWLFHFKGEPLAGTIWGGTHHTKRMLIHRDRCALLPYCNRITDLKPGQREHTITYRPGCVVKHYWSNSYRNLLHRHLFRYAALDAARMRDEGITFSFKRAICHPIAELHRSLRHFDGWRIGPRGWLLSGIYFVYVLAYEWLLLRDVLAAPAANETPGHEPSVTIPTLTPLTLDDAPARDEPSPTTTDNTNARRQAA